MGRVTHCRAQAGRLPWAPKGALRSSKSPSGPPPVATEEPAQPLERKHFWNQEHLLRKGQRTPSRLGHKDTPLGLAPPSASPHAGQWPTRVQGSRGWWGRGPELISVT